MRSMQKGMLGHLRYNMFLILYPIGGLCETTSLWVALKVFDGLSSPKGDSTELAHIPRWLHIEYYFHFIAYGFFIGLFISIP